VRVQVTGKPSPYGGFAFVRVGQVTGVMDQYRRTANRTFHIQRSLTDYYLESLTPIAKVLLRVDQAVLRCYNNLTISKKKKIS
jgi:hypothetical protein